VKLANSPLLRACPAPRDAKPELAALTFAKDTVVKTAAVTRWVEMDELASVFMASDSNLVTGLGIADGLITAGEGVVLLQEGLSEKSRLKTAGSVARIGLGLGGALPGVAGATCEGLLGSYVVGESLISHDHQGLLLGLTQIGVSAGVFLASQGIGGPLGNILILGSCATRVAGLAKHQLDEHKQST
jgi:hypothetical protein